MYQRNVDPGRVRKVRRIQQPLVVQQSAPSSIEPEGVWRDPPLPSEGTTSSSMSFDAVRDANSHDKLLKKKRRCLVWRNRRQVCLQQYWAWINSWTIVLNSLPDTRQ